MKGRRTKRVKKERMKRNKVAEEVGHIQSDKKRRRFFCGLDVKFFDFFHD